MSGLDDIPVSMEEPTHSPGRMALRALLREIATLLDQLTETGQGGSLDLRSLPLFPGDYDVLQNVLGRGEVQVALNTLGPSTLYETTVPGVWWITHRNEDEEVVSEFIEVTRCPGILHTPDEDLENATSRLQALDHQLSES